jgi:hypothetical protein
MQERSRKRTENSLLKLQLQYSSYFNENKVKLNENGTIIVDVSLVEEEFMDPGFIGMKNLYTDLVSIFRFDPKEVSFSVEAIEESNQTRFSKDERNQLKTLIIKTFDDGELLLKRFRIKKPLDIIRSLEKSHDIEDNDFQMLKSHNYRFGVYTFGYSNIKPSIIASVLASSGFPINQISLIFEAVKTFPIFKNNKRLESMSIKNSFCYDKLIWEYMFSRFPELYFIKYNIEKKILLL